MSKINTIYIPHNKNTMHCDTVKMPYPKKLFIPMAMSANTSSEVVVKEGEYVLQGQKIGEAVHTLSSPIFSPVSGKVVAVSDFTMPYDIKTKLIEIENDGKYESIEIKPPIINSREKLLDAVLESGVVGLGGAAFPTNVKLSSTDIRTMIVNVAECEPYITVDYRAVLEDYEDILCAVNYIKRFCNIDRVIFSVESNKPKAIEKLKDHEARILKSRYPQGAEKVIIYESTGKILPEGMRPYEIGIVVLNVTTLAKLGRFFSSGEPLMTKRITVDGTAVRNPQNVEVAIGTRISEVLDFCGLKNPVKKIILGGPMMGVSVESIDFPILKSTNAILALDEKTAHFPETTPCIRCGRCYRSCPFHLMPAEFERRYYSGDVVSLQKLHLASCIECGICSYVCPAKRDLVSTNRLAKNLVRSQQRKNNEK